MAYERRIKIDHTVSDIYKAYRKSVKKPMSEEKFKLIAYEFNRRLCDLIITKSFEYRIPYGLGFLRIKKKKIKFKLYEDGLDVNKNIIDWKATWDYWYTQYPGLGQAEIKKIPGKKVFFQTNDHTNGEVMRWYWDKRIASVKNVLVYSFKPVKGGYMNGFHVGRLGLSKWINSDERENEYYL